MSNRNEYSGNARHHLGLLIGPSLAALSALTAADTMFAPQNGTNKILRIDTASLTTTVATTALASTPNASAWDDANQRLFYANLSDGNLFVWDLPADVHSPLGKVADFGGPPSVNIASASFHDAAYYFIEDSTANLWRVTFDFSGPATIHTVTFIADITPDALAWGFGDIAIDAGGLLYGCGIRSGDDLTQLFTYDLDTAAFASIRVDSIAAFPGIQIGFDAAGASLFGSDAANGRYFQVDKATGALTELGTLSQPVADLSSLLSDTGPPTLDCPPMVLAWLPRGPSLWRSVTFTVTAMDNRDPSPSVVCVPPSGSLFRLGTTMVTCIATDDTGNQAVCMFPVIVAGFIRPMAGIPSWVQR